MTLRNACSDERIGEEEDFGKDFEWKCLDTAVDSHDRCKEVSWRKQSVRWKRVRVGEWVKCPTAGSAFI